MSDGMATVEVRLLAIHTHMLVRTVISAPGGRGKRGKKSSAHTHHVIAGPDARSSGAIIQTIGLNFDEAEIGLCNIGELASNRCEVGDDRTMVGFRPSVPAKVGEESQQSVSQKRCGRLFHWVLSYHWKSMLEPAATGMLLKPGVAFLWLFNLLARCQLLLREEVSD